MIGLPEKPSSDEDCMPELGFDEEFEPAQSVKKSPRGKSDEFEKLPRSSSRRSKNSGLDFGKAFFPEKHKKETSNPFGTSSKTAHHQHHQSLASGQSLSSSQLSQSQMNKNLQRKSTIDATNEIKGLIEQQNLMIQIETPGETLVKKGRFKSDVLLRFPMEDYPESPLPQLVWMLCFPERLKLEYEKGRPHGFVFAMTKSLDSARFYGACIRFYEPVTSAQKQFIFRDIQTSIPKKPLYAPKCLLLLSTYPIFSTLQQTIAHLYQSYFSSSTSLMTPISSASSSTSSLPSISSLSSSPLPLILPLERTLVNLLQETPSPLPSVRIEYYVGPTQLYTRAFPPLGHFQDLMDYSIEPMFQSLGVEGVVKLFGLLLDERSILFHSFQYTLLTQTTHALISLLYPFSWPFIYIPVIPQYLLQALQAPTPFVIGIHSSYLDQITVPDQVVLVDLDTGLIGITQKKKDSQPQLPPQQAPPQQPVQPPNSHQPSLQQSQPPQQQPPLAASAPSEEQEVLLPPKEKDRLLQILRTRLWPGVFAADFNFIETKQHRTIDEINCQVRFCFLEFFGDILHGYRRSITILKKYPKPIHWFDQFSFIREHPDHMEFLARFLGSQLFIFFLEQEIGHERRIDIFDALISIVEKQGGYRREEVEELLCILSCATGCDSLKSHPPNTSGLEEFYKKEEIRIKEEQTATQILTQNLNNSHPSIPVPKQSLVPLSFRQELFYQPRSLGNLRNSLSSPLGPSDQPRDSGMDENFETADVPDFADDFTTEELKIFQFLESSIELLLTANTLPSSDKALLLQAFRYDFARTTFVDLIDVIVSRPKEYRLQQEENANTIISLIDTLLRECSETNDFKTAGKMILTCRKISRLGIQEIQLWNHIRTQNLWGNRHFWEASFFTGIAFRRRLDLPQSCLDEIQDWSEMSEEDRKEMRAKEDDVIFGVACSFVFVMLSLGVDSPDVTRFFVDVASYCELPESSISELKKLITIIDSSNKATDIEIDQPLVPPPKAKDGKDVKKKEEPVVLHLVVPTDIRPRSPAGKTEEFYELLISKKAKETVGKSSTNPKGHVRHRSIGIEDETLSRINRTSSVTHNDNDPMTAVQPSLYGDSSSNAPAKTSAPYSVRVLTTEINGKKESVDCLKVFGRSGLVSSADGTLMIWDLTADGPALVLGKHKKRVKCLETDNHFLMSGGDDFFVRVWDLTKNSLISTFSDHVGPVLDLCVRGPLVLSASHDHTIKVWDFRTEHRCVGNLVGHSGPVKTVRLDNNYAISGSADQTVKSWDLRRMQCETTFSGHSEWINQVEIEKNRIYSCSLDSTIKIWDRNSSTCVKTLNGHSSGVTCFVLHGNDLISGAADNNVNHWHRRGEDFYLKTQLCGHQNQVSCVRVTENKICSGSFDQTMCVWDLESGKLDYRLTGHSDWVVCMGVLDNYLVSGSWDGTLRVYDFSDRSTLVSEATLKHRQLTARRQVTSGAKVGAITIGPSSASDLLLISGKQSSPRRSTLTKNSAILKRTFTTEAFSQQNTIPMSAQQQQLHQQLLQQQEQQSKNATNLKK